MKNDSKLKRWFYRVRKIPLYSLLFLLLNAIIWFLMIAIMDGTDFEQIPILSTIIGIVWLVNLVVTILTVGYIPFALAICSVAGVILFFVLLKRKELRGWNEILLGIAPFAVYLLMTYGLFQFVDIFMREMVRM